ncbi:MAG: RNA 2',3'-cyclic phosphodiesterase [Clostridia bacterium]|nr:RNA 2',3'-cyclic phosphodiesterase [Clostridia bacterium]
MRLFIAVKPDGAIVKNMTALQNSWRRERIGGNYTKPENIHLTLAFIGEYPNADGVTDCLEKLRFSPFVVETGAVGTFGDLWWAGLKECPPLNALAARVRKLLSDGGIPFDRKRFSPHITLIRQPTVPLPPPIALAPASMTVDSVSLMRSDRGKHGMIYTEIARSAPL